jgi:methyl-accepting chemotaxis protein
VSGNTTALAAAVGELRRSVVRVVRTSTAEVNRRASERHPIDLPCRIRAGGETRDARVVDLSRGGAHVLGGPSMRVGERGTLDIQGVGTALTFVVRSAGGGALHVELDLDAAAEARLRPFVEQLARRAAA